MKSMYEIRECSKEQAAIILDNHHYLTGISKGFKSGVNYGLFMKDVIFGVAIFTGFPVPELSKGMLGLNRDDQNGLYELSRFALHPLPQETEHNMSSWFLSKVLRLFRKNYSPRVILSYADADHHNGTLYAACNFKYYGLTDEKKDFYMFDDDGSLKKLSRGKTKGILGLWLPRSRKHRFAMVFDKSLNVLWPEMKWRAVS